MTVLVEGTVSANPVTQFAEPSSPVAGSALVAGAKTTIQVGPYVNNSGSTLKIVEVDFTNASENCTVTPYVADQLPIEVQAGQQADLAVEVECSVEGSYSFDVTVDVSE